MIWRYWRPCDHCSGAILVTMDREHLSYTCQKCGCRWGWGFILLHAGDDCPVHGRYAQHVAALAPDELQPFDDPSYVSF